MPVKAEGNKVIEKATGRVVGRSKNPAMAKKAANVRNAVHYSTWRPTRKMPHRSSGY